MSRPLVSIGLTFLNPGRFLSDAVRSIFAQTISDWELIIVDDGSTDGSLEAVKRIRDPRVKVVSNPQKRGFVDCLNACTDLATGEYLVRMDVDDIMHPMRLERQLGYLSAEPSTDVLGAAAFVVDDSRNIVGVRRVITESVLEALRIGIFIHPTVVARTSWFLANRYDPRYIRSEDRELFARCLPSSNYRVLSEPLLFYTLEMNGKRKGYLSSYHWERKVLLQHGPRLAGWRDTALLWSRSALKSAALSALYASGRGDLAGRRTFVPVDENSVIEAKRFLSAAITQPVPGWD